MATIIITHEAEIACWGDHMDVKRAATDPKYVDERKSILSKQGLKVWALGAHLAGQCVGDLWDPRLDGFAPAEFKGKPEKIREWAIQEMKYAARAAKAMGCKVVTGFMGSPVWKYWYSFPQTSQDGRRRLQGDCEALGRPFSTSSTPAE